MIYKSIDKYQYNINRNPNLYENINFESISKPSYTIQKDMIRTSLFAHDNTDYDGNNRKESEEMFA